MPSLKNFLLEYNYAAISGPREKDAIIDILSEMAEQYINIDKEHLVELVALEATRYGIQPGISVPFARSLIKKM